VQFLQPVQILMAQRQDIAPPAVVRPLNERDLARIRRKTRADMPDDYYERS
jgi:hypothetical protein